METEEPRDNKIAKNKEAEFDRQRQIKRASSDESRSRKWKRLYVSILVMYLGV